MRVAIVQSMEKTKMTGPELRHVSRDTGKHIWYVLKPKKNAWGIDNRFETYALRDAILHVTGRAAHALGYPIGPARHFRYLRQLTLERDDDGMVHFFIDKQPADMSKLYTLLFENDGTSWVVVDEGANSQGATTC